MTKLLLRAVALSTLTLCVMGAAAIASKVKIGPVKGGSYAGVVHDEDITIKVAANGRTASVGLPRAPAFCEGGSGPQSQSSKPARIAKGGITAKIGYSARGSHHQFATVTVKGSFYTFSGQKPVFDGYVKTKFKLAASRSCDGQESFQAILQ